MSSFLFGLNGGPLKRYMHLELKYDPIGKKGSLLMESDLKKRSPWVVYLGPTSYDKCPYKRGHRGDGHTKTEVDARVTKPQGKGCLGHQKLEEAGRILPGTSRGAQPCRHHDFRLPSQSCGSAFLLL